jgi:hypothetical protein
VGSPSLDPVFPFKTKTLDDVKIEAVETKPTLDIRGFNDDEKNKLTQATLDEEHSNSLSGDSDVEELFEISQDLEISSRMPEFGMLTGLRLVYLGTILLRYFEGLAKGPSTFYPLSTAPFTRF